MSAPSYRFGIEEEYFLADAETRGTPRGDLAPAEASTVALFERAAPSVVYVFARPRQGALSFDPETGERRQGGGEQTGSGFVWDAARINLPGGKTLDIDIPEGATDGQTLRLKGQGMPGSQGRPAGDAYVEIRVEPHAFFEARDNDIHVELPVTLSEAVLGGKVEVPTVGGAVMLNVPAGSNTGTSLRLKGRGLLDRKSVMDLLDTLEPLARLAARLACLGALLALGAVGTVMFILAWRAPAHGYRTSAS